MLYSLDKLIFITYRSSATKRSKILTMGSGLLQEFLCANIANQESKKKNCCQTRAAKCTQQTLNDAKYVWLQVLQGTP